MTASDLTNSFLLLLIVVSLSGHTCTSDPCRYVSIRPHTTAALDVQSMSYILCYIVCALQDLWSLPFVQRTHQSPNLTVDLIL